MANTLFDLAQQYLQQGLPDITGIFPPPPKTIGPVLPVLPKEPIEKPTGIETLFQTGRGPNDEFRGGGGDFGDLDLSDSKTVIRNVYTEVAPNKYEFVPTAVEAFRNMRSGLYQTKEGKNVDAMFTDAPTGGVLQLISNVFDPKQESFMEYPLGKIQGAYTNLASLLKGERNPTNLITAARQRLINRGSQIGQEFGGAGEFPTDTTPTLTGGGGSVVITPDTDEEKGRPDDPRANMGMRDTSASTAARDRAMGATGKLSGPPRSARFK